MITRDDERVRAQKARNPDNVIAAEQLFALFTEYKKAGFNEDQAMTLILQAVEALIIAQAMVNDHGKFR